MINPQCPVQLGDSYSFIPSSFVQYQGDEGNKLRAVVNLKGTVIQIHEKNRWFRVEADCHGNKIRECFKF